MSRLRGRGSAVGILPLVLAGVLLTGGCVAPQGIGSHSSAGLTTGPNATVTVTSTTVVAAERTDISKSVGQTRDYVTGALWNGGRVPGATSVVAVDDGASTIIGRLSYAETAGRASYRTVQTVQASGVGNPALFEMTTRSSSSDPATVVDVLHRSGNPKHDYLLTGEAFRAVAPTPWVSVPAGFGNGLGCALPGRKVVCEVTADLLANQRLDPSMPTNRVVVANGVGTLSSAITLRQLLASSIWRLRTAVAPAVARASVAELDRTLIPVTLSYDARPGPATGRPAKLTLNGTVTVGGVVLTIDLTWDETSSGSLKELGLPVPTKAIYTVLNSAQTARLAALAARSE